MAETPEIENGLRPAAPRVTPASREPGLGRGRRIKIVSSINANSLGFTKLHFISELICLWTPTRANKKKVKRSIVAVQETGKKGHEYPQSKGWFVGKYPVKRSEGVDLAAGDEIKEESLKSFQ